MNIRSLGHACFQIKTNGVSIIMDPYATMPGMSALPEGLTADLVTVSHSHRDHNNVDAISGNPRIISLKEGVDFRDITCTGISTFHDNSDGTIRGNNLVFVIESEGLRVCHLGDLGHILTDEQVIAIGLIDILMVPIGGHFTINSEQAMQVIQQLNPKIILPMHYKPEGSNLDIPISGVTDFITAFGTTPERQTELIINQASLPTVPTLVILE